MSNEVEIDVSAAAMLVVYYAIQNEEPIVPTVRSLYDQILQLIKEELNIESNDMFFYHLFNEWLKPDFPEKHKDIHEKIKFLETLTLLTSTNN